MNDSRKEPLTAGVTAKSLTSGAHISRLVAIGGSFANRTAGLWFLHSARLWSLSLVILFLLLFFVSVGIDLLLNYASTPGQTVRDGVCSSRFLNAKM